MIYLVKRQPAMMTAKAHLPPYATPARWISRPRALGRLTLSQKSPTPFETSGQAAAQSLKGGQTLDC
jgi:hypothetical protein